MSALRRIGTLSLTVGSACALGFLSFVGMFAVVPNIALCGAAFALAVAYEGQVFEEGIGVALERLFNKDYLVTGIIQKFLEQCESREEFKENSFLQDYRKQKNYLEETEEYLENLEEQQHHFDIFTRMKHFFRENAELKKLDQQIAEQEIVRAKEKKRLAKMQLFLFKQLNAMQQEQQLTTQQETADAAAQVELTKTEWAVRALLQQDFAKLSKEIQYRAWFMKFAVVFAGVGAVGAGLTALSSMFAGVAIFTAFNFIPGAVFITLAALAIGGTFLLQFQALSDIALNYGNSIKKYFQKNPGESNARFALRCFGAALVLTVAIIATISTAGTAWFAAKEGAKLFTSEGIAGVVRSITVAMMVIPDFLFSVSNSLDSFDDIRNSDYRALLSKTKQQIAALRQNETRYQFINPFRAIDAFLMKFAQGIYFVGHLLSMGATVDRWGGMQPGVEMAAGAANEAGEDLSYLPGKKSKHEHGSVLLRLMLLPVVVVACVFRLTAVLWDVVSTRDFKKSWNRMFFSEKQTIKSQPAQPDLSEGWKKQEVLEVCDDISTRLRQENAEIAVQKKQAASEIQNIVRSNEQLQLIQIVKIRNAAKPFAMNRSHFWQRGKTRSQVDMMDALENYNCRLTV